MKENLRLLVFVLLLVILAGAATWFVAVDRTNMRWEVRLTHANHKIDSLLTIQHIPVPPETVTVSVPAKPLPIDYGRIVDSAFAAGMNTGTDSIKSLFRYVSQPLDTTVYFSHGDTLLASYKPLTHAAAFTLSPAPIEVRTLTIHDSILVAVPAPDSRKWWEVPTAVASGAVIGAIAVLLAK
ncbi:MAG: hypothetical protein M1469_00670 [Bacteroidetes bacterium]|nr:hypothetical protein [Bacteroidota bacterium]MCL5266601.1 hypothetical protein [Bacteroidota bacterium]